VLIGVFAGTRPTKNEIFGVSLALFGCLFMILDPKAARNSQQTSSVVPALIDIGSAIFGAVYFLMSAKNIKDIPICLLISLMSFHTFFINSLIAKTQD